MKNTAEPVAIRFFIRSSTAMALHSNLFGQLWLSMGVWFAACVVAGISIAQPPPPPISPVRPKPPVGGPPPVVSPVPTTRPGQPAQPSATRPGMPSPGGKPAAVPPANKPPTSQPTAATPGARGKEKPKMTMTNPEIITKDGVNLRVFYYASDRGKEAIPVIICHELQGQASPYAGLVKSLWEAGCAVIVPEFRGHGGSREVVGGSSSKPLDAANMARVDVLKMIGGDLEAVKKFLRKENDEGKLNLNALVMVGIREGAVIASQWAVRDLNFPSLGNMKQGQDVKAMVLVSPTKIVRGVLLDETLQDRTFLELPFLIVVGRDSDVFGDADKFYKRLETYKKRAGKGVASGLQFTVVPTSLSGPALVNEAPGVIEKVTAFVKTELVDKSARIPWFERN